ncbi:hypothetical protein H0H87_011003 [Tephrocybe sp. NHM501043]|nr:hypothetical protein H0H87_011003 [Tephrocybe sp. NHM501043]
MPGSTDKGNDAPTVAEDDDLRKTLPAIQMAEPVWQEQLRLRLTERNAKESAYASIIEQYRRLAQQTKLLKERNASLLRAVGSVKGNPSASTVLVPGAGDDNPVRAAYMQSLESQISSLRDELATVYKTQGQNAQRLLSMNETLREKEEMSRIDSEGLRKSRDEITVLKRKVDQHAELMAEKDRTIEASLFAIYIPEPFLIIAVSQILHDEISTLQLELGQIDERNATLTKDNAKLLQRWLDAKQAEANKMNEANQFYENMRSKHQAVLNWRDGSEADANSHAGLNATSLSGKGDAHAVDLVSAARDGLPSLIQNPLEQTPNG